jgi:hypothetical protein
MSTVERYSKSQGLQQVFKNSAIQDEFRISCHLKDGISSVLWITMF